MADLHKKKLKKSTYPADIKKKIINQIKFFFNSKPNYNTIVEKISGSDYSDFDFKLSPNIHPSINTKRTPKKQTEENIFNFDELNTETSKLPQISKSNHSDDAERSTIKELVTLNELPKLKPNAETQLPVLSQRYNTIAPSLLEPISDTTKLTPNERVNFFIENIILLADPSHSPGFLLFRVKTVRILIDKNNKKTKDLVDDWRNYTTKEQAKDRSDCNKYSKIQDVMMKRGLYPQTVQKEYLEFVDKDGDCYNFLSYLLKQKQEIESETRENIKNIVEYILNSLKTEATNEDAIIKYIQIITFYINIYIYLWENKRLSDTAAPAYHKLPQNIKEINITHTKVCRNFLSLDTILRENSGLIVALAGDILHYFLQSPYFNTEAILDFEKDTKDDVNLLPPSDIILVQTQKKVTESLQFIKDIYETIKYSDYGYPDGVRVTINAIETEDTEIELFTDRFSKDKDDQREIIMVRIPVKSIPVKKL